MIRYGFACKSIGVPGTELRTLRLAGAQEEKLLEVGRHNLRAVGAMLRYCQKEGIGLLRISSDVIPLASHPRLSFSWQKRLEAELTLLGGTLRGSGIRVSMHPGQYTLLNSPRADVVRNALADLRFHADFLNSIGADRTARIILHLGGAYGDKQAALHRLEQNLRTLPEDIRERLALENDEHLYTIEDVIRVCERFALPAVFDLFHHALNPPDSDNGAENATNDWLDRAAATWDTGSGRQKIHYSQQMPGAKPGSHSQSIGMRDFLAFHAQLGGRDPDVMLEVKDKNLSAVKCANLSVLAPPRQRLTDEWARYKYLVLERDSAIYKAIRDLLKADKTSAMAFYALIEEALEQQISPARARNAAQHVWGYVDSLATPAEAKRVLADLQKIEGDKNALPRLKRRLLALAEKYDRPYLLRSLYFYM